MNGMEMQVNIVSVDTLRDAQDKPKDYNDLVVRVAGFSTYFVQMTEQSQNDLISRTEHAI
jgi:formate C-acetyltransferase